MRFEPKHAYARAHVCSTFGERSCSERAAAGENFILHTHGYWRYIHITSERLTYTYMSVIRW